jgi:hypothetical protein
MKPVLTCITGLGFLSLAGCATIVGSDTQAIVIQTTPAQVNIKIVDEDGKDVFDGVTPTTITLDKTTGHFFGGKSFTITLSKDGYITQTVDITHHANGWYKFGNIFPGGPIGYFAIDPFHGGMYDLSPASVNVTLAPSASTR